MNTYNSVNNMYKIEKAIRIQKNNRFDKKKFKFNSQKVDDQKVTQEWKDYLYRENLQANHLVKIWR
jgi:hypothetical protein